MTRPRLHLLLVALALPTAFVACDGGGVPSSAPPRELAPVPNPFGPDDPAYAPQPHRDRPSAVVASADGRTLYVTLEGTEEEPGREVAVVDAVTLETRRRIEVGPAPCALALHPAGRHLVVLNRFARYASVIDTARERVVGEVETPYYSEAIAFSPEGDHAVVANRWKDALLRWDVVVDGDDLRAEVRDRLRAPDDRPGIAVPPDPGTLVHLGGDRVLVASETALRLSLVDVAAGRILAEHVINGPVTDVALVGDFVVALHTGSGSGHPPDEGFDGDNDGLPGDGTANVTFQDVQNEVDVLTRDLELVHRYTSDSICCADYRDVDPDEPEKGLELGPRDTWPPSRVLAMPDRDTWIVAGAMPERVVPLRRGDGGLALAVVFGGSSEVQTFDVDASTGALAPRETAATGLYRTGFGARDAVALPGERLVVVDRLSETLTDLELAAAPGDSRRVVVGDDAGGAFPATDVELGEAFNTVTAPFAVDGDQTCVHCHRDGTPIAKPVSMPLLDDPVNGVRSVMSYRMAYDSRPWFVEAAMDEENFFPVINELARKENFCCEQSHPGVWGRYPSRAECVEDPSRDGCGHVLDCLAEPPPECAEGIFRGRALSRDRHFRDAALAVLGREESFGDSLYDERLGGDGGVERRPVRLGFDGITRALGLFLLARPRALPNPNAAWPTAAVWRGEELFRSATTGCAECHPLPVTATAFPTVVTSAPGPLRFPYVVTPVRHPSTGADVDVTSPAFLGTFPLAEQDEGGLRVGSPNLRGAWDRARFLHHGAATSLREVLAPPGHPALAPGERGFNERDGQPNSHGSTSHLDADDLEALRAYLETL